MEGITLSVRGIVEFVMRGGDIDNRFSDASSMYDGAKAHRRIQQSMGETYRSEVSLRIAGEILGIPVTVHGRADGVIEDGLGVTIDEIKTSRHSLDGIMSQSRLHLGQAKCYAYMLLSAMQSPPQGATVQLTYCQLDSGEIRRQSHYFTLKQLGDFFDGLLQSYGVWLELRQKHMIMRDESIGSLTFPYDSYRPGQKTMAVSVYRAIENGGRLYAQAPTGIGKTVSALFPSIKALGAGMGERIFYLTAKTVTRAVAQDALTLMASKGLALRSVTLRAKDKICMCEQTVCNPEHCKYAKGHFDRINDALLDLLAGDLLITPEVTLSYAEKHCVCPFEMQLDAALYCDVIIGDYNHVFDPRAYLRRFFASGEDGHIFLIDEAHNLPDRVRDMYTCSIGKRSFAQIKKLIADKTPEAKRLRRAATGVSGWMQELKTAMEGERHTVSSRLDETLVTKLRLFSASMSEWLASRRGVPHPGEGAALDLHFSVLAWIETAELFDSRFTVIFDAFGSDLSVTLFCLDPSDIIAQRLLLARASTLFSATLTPLEYYRDLCGGEPEDKMLSLPSPFDRSRLKLIAHVGISTKYRDRDAAVIPIARAINAAVSCRGGNYLVYFPSYEYMSRIREVFEQLNPFVDIVVQSADMDEQARMTFIEEFREDRGGTLVGFCVMGGVFSEGIDLVGSRLIGTVIVGVGMPKVSLRQQLIRDYFEQTRGAGFDYAYVYPGMNKVMQAAGRVIRSSSDFGAVVLIDSRFGGQKYLSLMPEHWSQLCFAQDEREVRGLIEAFEYFY